MTTIRYPRYRIEYWGYSNVPRVDIMYSDNYENSIKFIGRGRVLAVYEQKNGKWVKIKEFNNKPPAPKPQPAKATVPASQTQKSPEWMKYALIAVLLWSIFKR